MFTPRPTVLSSTLLAVTLVVIGGAQPAAAATNSEERTVTFAVLGDMDARVGEEVSLDDLTRLGATPKGIEAAGASISADGKLTAPVEPHAIADGPTAPMAAVTYSWTSKDNKRVYLRDAPRIKIETTHNLTVSVVQRVTKSATTILAAGSGTNYGYYLRANEVTCYVWGCYVTRSVNVRVLVDYRRYGTQTYGVVTAYCEGISGKCPDYVKNALNT